MSIRSTSKAIILDKSRVLLTKCYDVNNGNYYALPGGGQDQYETMHDAVVRECLEETGYSVAPVRFAALCEEICDDMDFRQTQPVYAHKMYHIFVCTLLSDEVLSPTETDDKQIGIEWVGIDQLEHIRLLPVLVGENIMKIIASESPLFLGSAHIAHNHG